MRSRPALRVAALAAALLGWLCAGASRARAQVVLNEVLASNTFSDYDDDGDAEDWVELYNMGAAAVDLAGWSLTDDPLVARWQFPAVSIPAGGHLTVWLSSKNRFVPAPEAIAGDPGGFVFDASIIGEEEEWRYLVGDPASQGPPADWAALDFDDASWPLGRAGFGYADGDDFTELADQTGAVFIRKRFRLDDPARLANIVLQIDYDDGFAAYLNGVRVAAANAPAEAPSFASLASGNREAGTPALFDLTPHLDKLLAGDNVLALAGLNDLPSSDMSLHPRLGVVPLILHANFKVDRMGEFLGLARPDGSFADSVTIPVQTEDHSWGRSPDGAGSWFYFLTPTHGAANTSRPFADPLADRIRFDPAPGSYPGASLPVTLGAGISELTRIHYTTDGSVPTTASALYTGPIDLGASTAFRAAGFIEGERATRVVSASYFIDTRFALPILSVTMAPDDFLALQTSNGARGRASEREGFLEVIDRGQRAVAVGFGMRLHGGAGRNGDFITKKAYKAYFRGAYGAKKLDYPIIPETPVDEFDKLVLRSGFNDSFRTNARAAYIRDEAIRDLHEDTGALAAHGSWCVLFVNMSFRGIYNIVERMDEEFASAYREEEDWDVIKTGNDVLVGTIDEWRRMRDYAVANDLSQDALFDQASAMIDVENFTSYMIVNMWAQNQDWPHNNWYAARPRTPDGRWIFLCWDSEFGLGLIPSGFASDTFEFVFTRTGYHREVFEKLLANSGYRTYFIQELDRHLNGALAAANVRARLQSLRSVVDEDMPAELALYGRAMSSWEANLAEMDAFAQNRGPLFWSNVLSSTRFSFDAVTTPRVSSVAPSTVVNTGGLRVSLLGIRFQRDTQVAFNGIPSEVEYRSGTLLLAALPFDASLAGLVDVETVNPVTGERSIAAGALDVRLPVPEVVSVTPSEGPSVGGDTVELRGRHFVDGLEVLFDGVPSPRVTIVSRQGLTHVAEVVTPPGRGVARVDVRNHQPALLSAATSLTFEYRGLTFLRGDAVTILGYLFIGNEEIGCLAAADANASLGIDLSDAVRILEFLFQGAGPPAAPYPTCGDVPEAARLSCETASACGP